jgi:hypothetical protein
MDTQNGPAAGNLARSKSSPAMRPGASAPRRAVWTGDGFEQLIPSGAPPARRFSDEYLASRRVSILNASSNPFDSAGDSAAPGALVPIADMSVDSVQEQEEDAEQPAQPSAETCRQRALRTAGIGRAGGEAAARFRGGGH